MAVFRLGLGVVRVVRPASGRLPMHPDSADDSEMGVPYSISLPVEYAHLRVGLGCDGGARVTAVAGGG